jgi:hypothetical protein
MPVRSLHSSVLAWPRRQEVEAGVTSWAQELAHLSPGLVAVGLFGSYARGDWGVGSDVDLIVVHDASASPFGSRTLAAGTSPLPVPADHLICTLHELLMALERGGRFADTLRQEVVWVFRRDDFPGFPGRDRSALTSPS